MSILPYLEAVKMAVAQAAESAPEGAAGAEGAPAPGPAGGLGSMLPMLIAFVAIFYFLMIRPQQKRDKARREMLAAVAKGDSVVTTGGICGTVVHLSESNVVLRVDTDVTMEFVRGAIAQVVKKDESEKGGDDK